MMYEVESYFMMFLLIVALIGFGAAMFSIGYSVAKNK